MSIKTIYNKIKRYTDDKVVLSLAETWMDDNKFFKFIYKWFGIEINRKFNINISKRYNTYGNLETIFNIYTGSIFKKEITIRLI